MASITFQNGTIIPASWLNDVNDAVYSTIPAMQAKLAQWVSVKDFGAVGDGSTDDTAAIQAAINSGLPFFIPAGTYLYSGVTGLDRDNISIRGDGSNCTVLKFTGSGIGLDFGTSAGFKQAIDVSGFTVEGNTNTTIIVRATAIARCQWTDINVRYAAPTGIGFVFRACMLNRFNSLVCSQDKFGAANPPEEGFNIEALAPYGNSSNNSWTNCYAEGAGVYPGVSSINIGIRMSGGDQNVFISGSPESCKTWGLVIASGCRYNTFIGVGFENLNAAGGDFNDGGSMNQFINCYASEKAVMAGEMGTIQGGYYERVYIDSGSQRNTIRDVRLGHWNTGLGGIYDSGTGTVTRNAYNEDTGAWETDIYPRFLMALQADQNNITGNGNAYTMAWDTIFDDNHNCDGVYFAAPVKGRYQLECTMTLKNIESTATSIQLKIVTTARTFVTEKRLTPSAGNTTETISVSGIADMAAGNGAYVIVTVTGMPGNTVDAIGNPSNMWCTFSGNQIH